MSNVNYTQTQVQTGQNVSTNTKMPRRTLLSLLFWSVTGVSTLGTVSTAGRFLAGNSFEPRTVNWVALGKLSEFGVGSVHQVSYALKAKDAWLDVEDKGALYAFTDDGKNYTVLDGTCTHLGCSVQWMAADNQFECHCHAAVFARDGAVVSGPPPKPLRALQSKIDQGSLWAHL